MVTAALLCAACDAHFDVPDTAIRPGHVLCTDGTVMSYAAYEQSGKRAIAVLFDAGQREDAEGYGYAVYLWDIEPLAFADSLAGTYSGSDRAPGVGSQYDLDYAADAQARRAQAGHAMNRFLLPLYQGDAFQPGSTDVGDVSWQCPTAQIHVAAWPNGCPGHSWQNVSCGRTDIGHKAALHAGKVLAAAAIDLLTDPALLEEAKTEFQRRTAAGYTCPIPADAVPTIAD